MRDDAFLVDCLVDGETGTGRRRSKTHRRSVAAALIVEGIVISGLVLWPLLTPATPPPQFKVLTPVPYLGRTRLPRAVHASAQNAASRRIFPVLDFSQSQVRPVVRATGSEIQNMPAPTIPDQGPGSGSGVFGAPDGFGSSAVVPAPPSVRVIRRSEQIQESQLITRVTPPYPQIARAAHISGIVELLVLVGRDGGVLSVQVLSGNPLLAAAAKQAVEQWRYRPALLDGQPVEVEARVTVNFVMDE